MEPRASQPFPGKFGLRRHRPQLARALTIAAEEKATTARATEIAERDKIINVIAARKAAETNAMPVTVMAEAERQAAANKRSRIGLPHPRGRRSYGLPRYGLPKATRGPALSLGRN